jgi:hypothetical protein
LGLSQFLQETDKGPTIQRILTILSKKTDVLSSNLSVSPDYLEMYTMGA